MVVLRYLSHQQKVGSCLAELAGSRLGPAEAPTDAGPLGCLESPTLEALMAYTAGLTMGGCLAEFASPPWGLPVACIKVSALHPSFNF